jgi:hypothetical protein
MDSSASSWAAQLLSNHPVITLLVDLHGALPTPEMESALESSGSFWLPGSLLALQSLLHALQFIGPIRRQLAFQESAVKQVLASGATISHSDRRKLQRGLLVLADLADSCDTTPGGVHMVLPKRITGSTSPGLSICISESAKTANRSKFLIPRTLCQFVPFQLRLRLRLR